MYFLHKNLIFGTLQMENDFFKLENLFVKVQICTLVALEKSHIWHLENCKRCFPHTQKVRNPILQGCLPCKYVHMSPIWTNYHKLLHIYGYDLSHLDWKSWIFVHDSSLWEHVLFEIFIFQDLYFPRN
jgi:hypothetical protein